jgi:hypothetical protein
MRNKIRMARRADDCAEITSLYLMQSDELTVGSCETDGDVIDQVPCQICGPSILHGHDVVHQHVICLVVDYAEPLPAAVVILRVYVARFAWC